jgi:hypothetical protein
MEDKVIKSELGIKINKEDKINRFYHQIDWSKEFNDNDKIGLCPLCGKSVHIQLYGTYGESFIVQCPTKDCLKITNRGL